MYKPSESARPGQPRKGRKLAAMAGLTAVSLAAIAAALLQLPLGAKAGVAPAATAQAAAAAPQDAPSVASAQKERAPRTYQLRCWQYGRLLFDEGPVTLGGDARQTARLVAIDRNGVPLIVTDSGHTTCLARPSAPPPNLALPR